MLLMPDHEVPEKLELATMVKNILDLIVITGLEGVNLKLKG